MVKKVRKSDLVQMLSEAIISCFEIKQEDFEIDVNSIYAKIKIKENVLLDKVYVGDGIIPGKKSQFEKYIDKLTFSNIKVASTTESFVDHHLSLTLIKLSVNYEIVD